MWVGYNSIIFKDLGQKQIIAYLTTNASPTSIAVVKLTLDQKTNVAKSIFRLRMI